MRQIINEFGKSEWVDYEKTILLLKIKNTETGIELCDHLWVNYTKGFEKLGTLNKGDLIAFDARITDYQRGLGMCADIDYKISRPTKLSIKRRKNGW